MDTRIYCSTLTLPAAELKRANLLPRFRDRDFNGKPADAGLREDEKDGFGWRTSFRELPYTEQDSYSRALTPRDRSTVVLENDAVRAEFLADFGGRLWSLADKKTGRDLLFTNPVHRIGNLAVRGAWFSGGIEWNLGQYGHTCLTCEPVFFAVCRGASGEPFLRMYEFERLKGLFFQIDFHLKDGDAKLYAHIRIVNPQDAPASLYCWTNTAVPERAGARVFSGTPEVITIRPQTPELPGGFLHDRLPYLRCVNGRDATFPTNFVHSNEFFFQNRGDVSRTWESVTYPDGTAFWERSTPVLRYRKMFCWGMQRGGKHWKDFLSLPGQGDYLEVQAGLFPTQVHGGDLEAHGAVRFTQVFGGMNTDPDRTDGVWQDAQKYVSSLVDAQLSPEELRRCDAEFCADEEARPAELLHRGSGWGALEEKRQPGYAPKGLVFPADTLREEQKPWLALLETGKYPEFGEERIPLAWMTGARWEELLSASLEKPENVTAAGLLQLGAMLVESGRRGEGEKTIRRSQETLPSAAACFCLAQLALADGRTDDACRETAEGLRQTESASRPDFALAAVRTYTKAGRCAEAWDCYASQPEEIRSDERLRFAAARAALETRHLDFLERQFCESFATTREGDTSLLDLWFEYQAALAAEKRGTAVTPELLAEARRLRPPYDIDFRMTE